MKSKMLIRCMIVLLSMLIGAQSSFAQADPSLIVCHKYDNVNLGNDGSIYNNDLGTPFSMPLTTDHNGTANSAYAFTPTNFARIPHNASQILGSCFTIAAWVKPSTGSYGVPFNGRIDIVSKWGMNQASYVMSLTPSGNIMGHTYNGSTVEGDTSMGTIPLGVWSHIAITFDGAKMRFFINGVLNSTANHTIIPTSCTYPIGIGHEGDNVTALPFPVNTNTGFNGAIDEVRILKRVLSPGMITYMMNSADCITPNDLFQEGIYLKNPGVVCKNKAFTLLPNESYYLTLPHTYYWGDGSSSSDTTHTYADTGTYTVKFIVGGNCPDTAERIIKVVDCTSCDVTLNLQRFGCNRFKLKFSSIFVNVECYKWVIDSVVLTSYDPTYGYVFSPGTHEICLRYFGPNIHYPDIICCSEKCTTITIPVPTEQHLDTTVCSLTAEGTMLACLNIDLNDYAPPTTFSYKHPLLPTFIGGSQVFCLPPGSYNINYYDKYGCLLKTLYLTISFTSPVVTTCNGLAYLDSCVYTIDPNTIMPDCDSCPITVTTVVSPAMLVMDDVVNKVRYYERFIYDAVSCRYCYFNFSISLDRTCEVTPIFTIYQPELFKVVFTGTSSGKGVPCGAPAWKLYYRNNTPWTLIRNIQGPSILPDSLQPGEYNMCFTVQYCYCEEVCTGEYCFKFYIHGNGELDIISEHFEMVKPPEKETNKDNKMPSSEGARPEKPASDVKVFPNPSGGIFNIIYNYTGKEHSTYSMQVYDAQGRVLLTKKDMHVNHAETFNLFGFASGVYTVKITLGDKIEYLKVMKE